MGQGRPKIRLKVQVGATTTAPLSICSGVTGMAGCLPTVSPAPVTAQVRAEYGYWPGDPQIARALAGGVVAAGQAAAGLVLIGMAAALFESVGAALSGQCAQTPS